MKGTAISTAASTERNIKLKAMSQVLKEYSSDDMGGHIAKLYEAFRGDIARETIACFENAWNTKDFSIVDPQLNNARRRVAWYFTKIHSLCKVNALDESDVMELTTEEQINDILLGKVEQIDKPIRRGKGVYTFFRNLYPDKNVGKE